MWDECQFSAVHKLSKDGNDIGDRFDQFMYIYSRLRGDTAKLVSTVAKDLLVDRIGDEMQFLKYQDTVFGDPNKEA